jgi:hypothetical protein
LALAVTVKVAELPGVVPGVTVTGVNAPQFNTAGNAAPAAPAQASVTALLNPLIGVIVTVKLAAAPGLMGWTVLDTTLTLKSGGVTVTITAVEGADAA